MLEQVKNLIAVMEILPDGLLIVDQSQRIVSCNSAAERLFGYRRGELIDQPLDVLIPRSYRETHQQNVKAYGPTSAARPMENSPILSGVSKEGRQLPLSIGISIIEASNESYFIAVVRDAKSLDDTLNEAISLAHIDPLTQLGNRRHLSSQLALRQENANETRLALLYLDLDRFKPLNDEYGHEMGDEVLTVVARRLRRSLRKRDTCVRLGGDEFIVLIADVTEPRALEDIARKLHHVITAPIRALNETVRVGVSIGGAIGSPYRSDADTLLERADAAMYRAKTTGAVYCFHESQPEAAD